MQFGFNLPLSGPSASPAMLARLAAEGEAIGYDYAAISDHIVEPIDIHARYPYSESGEFPAGSRGERHEQLTAIAYLAAKTSRLKFLTSVMRQIVSEESVHMLACNWRLQRLFAFELRRWEAQAQA